MEKPSCPNCPTFKAGIDRGESGMGYCETDHQAISWQQWCILKEKGCLCHPQAREYLMEPVLKELERRFNESFNKHTVIESAYADGMRDAARFIGKGVEK